MALWLRRPAYVYLSCLLLNVAGTILWWSWAAADVNIFSTGTFGPVAGLVQANVICLAVGSIALDAGGIGASRRAFRMTAGAAAIEPAAHAAARLAACLLGMMVAICVADELLGLEHVAPQRLDWIALAAVALAAVVCLWDRSGPGSSCRRSMGWD